MFSPQGMGLSPLDLPRRTTLQVPFTHPPGPPMFHPASTHPPNASDHLANVWKYFEIPTWDGSDHTWVSTKMKMTTALQKCGMQYLLTESITTNANTYHSQLFAIGMLESFTGEALRMFLGRHEQYWRKHDIEMYHKLLSKYESTTPDSILSLETKWGKLQQSLGESFTAFCNQVELLAFRLQKDEISMFSNALR